MTVVLTQSAGTLLVAMIVSAREDIKEILLTHPVDLSVSVDLTVTVLYWEDWGYVPAEKDIKEDLQPCLVKMWTSVRVLAVELMQFVRTQYQAIPALVSLVMRGMVTQAATLLRKGQAR